jgi:hypothetical protein
MEPFEQKLVDAGKRLYVADHMLTSTYPLLRDPKLLLGVLENTFFAFKFGISGFMEHERYFKRISPYHKDSELTTFKLKIKNKYGFDSAFIKTYEKLADAVKLHKTSPIEFSRNDSFVIASDTYSLKKISPEELKKDIKTCKDFLVAIDKIIQR